MRDNEERDRLLRPRSPARYLRQMKLRTVLWVLIAGLTAALVAQAASDKRLDGPKEDVRRLVAQIGAPASADAASGSSPHILSGAARVIDGGTLEFLNPRVTVELAGIDTCDSVQSAHFNGTPWPCGAVATAWLVSQTLGQSVECEVLDRLYNGLVIGRCGVNGADIAAEALLAGQAVVGDNVKVGIPLDKYRELQARAKSSHTGIWSSTFTPPRQFRRDRVQDRETQIRRIEPTTPFPQPDIDHDEK